MLVITKLIIAGIAIVCAVTLAFIILDFVAADRVKSTSSKKINRVHFYAARDKNGMLYLYLGKPNRIETRESFYAGGKSELININPNYLKRCGFNKEDFKDLKWEDEPVEVFLNMED